MFCGNCVTKLPVYRMNYVDPALVCNKCESTCTTEADFYEHHLKVLCKGNPMSFGIGLHGNVIYRCQIPVVRFERSGTKLQLLPKS